MIEYKNGDLFKEEVDALVNTVNCVGIMGRGLALQFKNAFPANYKAYAAACESNAVMPGRMFVYDTDKTSPRFIINFPTKQHWRDKSSFQDIENGLDDLARVIQELKITSIAIPPLGCGLGGLDWLQVRTAIERRLSGLSDVRIIIFEPNDVGQSYTMRHVPNGPKMTPGCAALLALMERYLRDVIDPWVTLPDVHMLMYFMQVSGEPLNLTYTQAACGPYAENLHPVLQAIEGFYVTGYAESCDMQNIPLNLVPGAAQDAAATLCHHPETQARFNRVCSLIDWVESSFGLELLASVHWVVTQEAPESLAELTQRIYAWDLGKMKFSKQQIALAAQVLLTQGWIEVWFNSIDQEDQG